MLQQAGLYDRGGHGLHGISHGVLHGESHGTFQEVLPDKAFRVVLHDVLQDVSYEVLHGLVRKGDAWRVARSGA